MTPAFTQGVIEGINKCIAMGPPWLKRHCQTELMEYVIVETEWCETFAECWAESQSEHLGTDEAAGDAAKPAANAGKGT